MKCAREIAVLLLLFFHFLFVAQAQTKEANTAAYRIFEDLPLNEAGKKSVITPKESIAEKISTNIFITTTLSKTTCYTGEPVKITYELYSALLNESTVSKRPSFNGFTVHQLAFSNDESNYKKIAHKNYRVFTIDKCVITPYETGTLQLDPIAIYNKVSFENEKGETRSYAGEVFAKPTRISVLPLPEKDKPASFTGGVGKFSITLKAGKTEFAVGENNRIQIDISGTGNLADFSFPAIGLGGGLIISDTKEKFMADVEGTDFFAGKTYIATINAKREGSYTIEPLRVSVFNPEKGRYEELHTAPLKLIVHKTTATAVPPPAVVTTAPAEKRFTWLPPVLVVSGAVLLLLAIWRTRRSAAATKKEPVATAPEPGMPVETDYAALTTAALGQTAEADFINAYKEVIKKFLIAKTHPVGNEPEELMIEKLSASEPEMGAAISAIIKKCDEILYSPGTLNRQARIDLTAPFFAILDKVYNRAC